MMLVSDKYGFIIATPVKTGTTTLLGMADSWRKQGGPSNVLRAFSGDPVTKHRMVPPEGCEEYDRYITIRNPESRLPSMYEWMRKWPHPSSLHNAIWDAENRKRERLYGWREFIIALAMIRTSEGYGEGGKRRKGTRQPYMWTDNQEEHYNYLQGIDSDGSLLDWYREKPPEWLECGDLERNWMTLMVDYEVDEDALYELRVPHLNKSKDRLASTPDEYWELLGRRERRLFTELSRPDAECFGWGLLGDQP